MKNFISKSEEHCKKNIYFPLLLCVGGFNNNRLFACLCQWTTFNTSRVILHKIYQYFKD